MNAQREGLVIAFLALNDARFAVCHIDAVPPFICEVHGSVEVSTLVNFEAQLQTETGAARLDRGFGRYWMRIYWEASEYAGPYCYHQGGPAFELVSFEPEAVFSAGVEAPQ